MKIGYARVSRTDQNLQPQLDQLKAAGVERNFTDKISGAKDKRVGFEDLLATVRKGDCVIVCRLDRLARSLPNLLEIAAEFERRGLDLRSLAEAIDTTTTTGKLVFHLFGAIAEFERNLIIDRTNAGLKAAKARGKVGGRKPALSPEGFAQVEKMISDGRAKGKEDPEIVESAARAMKVSERTIRRVMNNEYKFSEKEASV